jgi:hypothetical protein
VRGVSLRSSGGVVVEGVSSPVEWGEVVVDIVPSKESTEGFEANM